MKVVAFFVRHFTERGTEVSTYNYAHFNEKILSNKSIIIAYNGPKQKKIEPFINTTRKIFEKRFEVIEIKKLEHGDISDRLLNDFNCCVGELYYAI